MKKTDINQGLEYLSATMILSYFFVHSIFLVLIGITFSIYLININFINSIIRATNKNLVLKNSALEFYKNNKIKKSNSINIESKKVDKKLTLVESVEELGFIPSIDEDKESSAA